MCKRKAILNKWFVTRLKGVPAKEFYEFNMEHPDIQSAIEIINMKPLDNQSAIEFSKGLPLKSSRTYKKNNIN